MPLISISTRGSNVCLKYKSYYTSKMWLWFFSGLVCCLNCSLTCAMCSFGGLFIVCCFMLVICFKLSWKGGFESIPFGNLITVWKIVESKFLMCLLHLPLSWMVSLVAASNFCCGCNIMTVSCCNMDEITVGKHKIIENNSTKKDYQSTASLIVNWSSHVQPIKPMHHSATCALCSKPNAL